MRSCRDHLGREAQLIEERFALFAHALAARLARRVLPAVARELPGVALGHLSPELVLQARIPIDIGIVVFAPADLKEALEIFHQRAPLLLRPRAPAGLP